MKGIGDGRQDVWLLLPDTFRTMQERNDQISLEWFIFVVSMKTCYIAQLKFHSMATRSNNDVFIVSFRHCLKVN